MNMYDGMISNKYIYLQIKKPSIISFRNQPFVFRCTSALSAPQILHGQRINSWISLYFRMKCNIAHLGISLLVYLKNRWTSCAWIFASADVDMHCKMTLCHPITLLFSSSDYYNTKVLWDVHYNIASLSSCTIHDKFI